MTQSHSAFGHMLAIIGTAVRAPVPRLPAVDSVAIVYHGLSVEEASSVQPVPEDPAETDVLRLRSIGPAVLQVASTLFSSVQALLADDLPLLIFGGAEGRRPRHRMADALHSSFFMPHFMRPKAESDSTLDLLERFEELPGFLLLPFNSGSPGKI
jgi:hypothetical protein